MNPILRNILALVAGLFLGGLVNGMIIKVSPYLIAPPPGVDLTTEDGLIAAMHLMQPKHFILPFLAHALGTFVAGFLATKIAATYKKTLALVCGVVFLAGGAYMVWILPSPWWFNLLDLTMAYMPMAYLGWLLGVKGQRG